MLRRCLFPVVMVLLLLLPAVISAEEHHHEEEEEGDDHVCHSTNATNATCHDAEEDTTDLVHGLKAMSVLVTFALSMVVNSIVIFTSFRMPPVVLSLMSSFSAGVMLTTGVCHILAEATETMVNQYDDGARERYRPAFVVCVGGYVLMVLVQRGLFHLQHGHGHGHGHGPAEGEEEKKTSPIEPPAVVAADVAAEEGTSPVTAAPASEVSTSALATSLVLLVAFVIHSVVEGMALGLQTTKEGVLLVFVAIVVHQWAEDFTYSLSTGGGSMKLPPYVRFILSTCEALSCPVGIAIGWGIGVKSSKVANAYLLAFSSGTFVMISCTEVVPETLPSGRRNRLQFLALFLGVGALYMLLALMYNKEAHNH